MTPPYGGHAGYEAGGGSDSHAVSSVHSRNILQSYKQEDVVAALMTQLREKHSELVKTQEEQQSLKQQHFLTDQTNKEMKRKLDQCAKALLEKDKRIDVLERSLLHEREEASAILDLKLGALHKSYDKCKCTLDERNRELDALRPRAEELASKVEEYEQSTSLEGVKALEQKLVSTTGRLETCSDRMDELEKQNKSKDWVIKSLKDELVSVRSSERQLQCEVASLKKSVNVYESEFNGTSVDVQMLIAKLKDSENRTKDLQGQIRRLTNKKLNELVLRSSPTPHKMKDNSQAKLIRQTTGNSSRASAAKIPGAPADHASVSNEEFTYNSSLEQTDSIDSDPFSPKNEEQDDVISDFKLFCCAQAASSEEDYQNKPLSPLSTSTIFTSRSTLA